jgi:DNA-binding response OmpR family regulator
MNGRKILIVDDEARLVDVLKAYLERDGYRAVTAYDGKQALFVARREKPDLILLDLMLPEIDGLEVCRTLRKESDTPIIMLTARSEETDKLIGLELGADDYVTKPFSPREVVARVRAVLRRARSGASAGQETITVGDLVIDQARHEVRRKNEIISITPTEFDLLWALASNKGRVLSRLQLMEKALGESYEGYERTIDAHIKNLRRKIEVDPAHPRYVQTVFGVGYKCEGV